MNELRRREGRFAAASLAFCLNFGLALLVFLPFIVSKGGILTLFADFNKQQIPFSIYANEKIKAGDVYWSWASDLGTNFIGAFSFYNLGSPFFWLSLLFPARVYPYLIGPLLMLKYAVAGLTAQLYLRRFVKMPAAALLGSLLYAWSGFQMTNLQFNHFHDVVAFFPLFLLALEELVQERRRGRFALMTAVMACLNYFFFVGQVAFAVIYFCFRFAEKQNRKTGESFLRLSGKVLGEGLLGVLFAAWIFLPSALFVNGNPRSDLSAFDYHYLFYHGRQYLMLIRAALFPADPMGMNSAIYGAEYSSIGFYLPVFGFTALYIFMRRCRGVLQRLFLFLVGLALLPLTNSLFFAFNGTYYARWFYMPSLIAALITVIFLERAVFVRNQTGQTHAHALERDAWIRFRRKDLLIPGLVTLFFALLIFLWPETIAGKLLYLPDYWLLNVILALLGYLLTVILLTRTANLDRQTPREQAGRRRLIAAAIALVMGFSAFSGWESVYRMQRSDLFDRPESIQAKLYDAGKAIGERMPRDHIYRIYHDRVNWNISFVADVAPVNSFISTISSSTFEFYQNLGYGRFVYTHMPETYSGLLSFLSVDFIFEDKWRDDLDLFYEYKSKAGSVFVFWRDEADRLPFGFTMDRYLPMERFLDVDAQLRHKLLIEAVILDEDAKEAIDALSDSPPLTVLSDPEIRGLLAGTIEDARAERKHSGVLSSIRHRRGFSLLYDLDEAAFAYFSVPYDKGWTATVNGQEAQIIETNGFMLLALNAGRNQVEFRYRVPGFKIGLLISFASIVVFLVYMKIRRRS